VKEWLEDPKGDGLRKWRTERNGCKGLEKVGTEKG
jgi:hypothetical protein